MLAFFRDCDDVDDDEDEALAMATGGTMEAGVVCITMLPVMEDKELFV